jgi:2-polyprenyl-3-methyl-5-hydroxy-6-metoxy-1,4-benzoquinol methylase
MKSNLAMTNWDRAYKDGKYDQEKPVKFVEDIVNVITKEKLQNKLGFYPGCGNGRNFIPLIDAGLKLEGNDISSVAVDQLKSKRPEAVVSVGDFLTHKTAKPYKYIISLQLFQHTNNGSIEELFKKTRELLSSGGIFVLRVNSIHTQIAEKHKVIKETKEGGLSIGYESGQKKGQTIHFYSAEEIHSLTRKDFSIILPLREEFIPRSDGTYWVQWETILEKRPQPVL